MQRQRKGFLGEDRARTQSRGKGGDFLHRGKYYPTSTEWSVTLSKGEKAIAYSPATRRVWGGKVPSGGYLCQSVGTD